MSATQETASFWSGYRQLEEELATGTVQPPKPLPAFPKKIPIDQLEVVTSVFQPRAVGDELASERHIAGLMEAIMHETGNVLDPVTVWWSGKRWLILDGHHRLQAHNKLRAKGKGAGVIPVTIFKGTLQDAHLESIRLNAKDKLAMGKEDKLTKAWHIVMLNSSLSVREIATVCKVGKSSVGRMNNKRVELIEKHEGEWLDIVDGLAWREVVNLSIEREIDDEWEERQAIEWAKRLNKTFGNKPQNQPQLFAKAIEIYSPHLYEQLVEWLGREPNDDF